MALTVLRYYFNKMDNVQKKELEEKMGISMATIYHRIRSAGQLKISEAMAFVDHVQECFGITVKISDLTKEVAPVEQGGSDE